MEELDPTQMQIVETANEGLKRAYCVTIPASDIAARIDGEITRIAPQVRMPGFRPGKVPVNLVRKLHGPALHQEALQTAIREALDALVTRQGLRPATQPAVALADGYDQGKDAELAVSLEVLPVIEAPSIEGLKLEKLIVPVTEAEVDEAVARIAQGQSRFADAGPGAVARTGDQIVIDFVGKLDGVAFDGGTAEDAPLELGAGRFIPGFEEQLIGVTAGEDKTITVTFPDSYLSDQLKGQVATFDVAVKAVKVPADFVADDDFAKQLGLESIEQLRGLLRGQLEQQTASLTRTQMKRQLLDVLAAGHNFAVPAAMVEAEFDQIWQQLTEEAAKEADPAAAMQEIEAEKDDYRRIAERRVRLGLLLSEIGQANGVVITNQEMDMLIRQAAEQYREADRQRFLDYIRSEPLAAAQLRAPLYEDKVVDFLFDKAEVTTREVTREALQAAIEADENSSPVTGDAPAAPEAEAEPATPAAAEAPAPAPAQDVAPAEPAPVSDDAVAPAPAPRKRAAPKKTAPTA